MKDSPSQIIRHADDDGQAGPSTSRAGQPNFAQPGQGEVVNTYTSSEEEEFVSAVKCSRQPEEEQIAEAQQRSLAGSL